MAEKGAPLVKNCHEMILDRVQPTVMSMLDDATLTEILPVLRAVK